MLHQQHSPPQSRKFKLCTFGFAHRLGSVVRFQPSKWIHFGHSRKARGVATRTCIWRFDAPGTFPKTILQRNQFVNQFLETDCNLIAKQKIASPLDLYPRFSIWLQCGLRFDWTSTRLSKKLQGPRCVGGLLKERFPFPAVKKTLEKSSANFLTWNSYMHVQYIKGMVYTVYIYNYIYVYNMYTTYFFENMEMTSKP